MEIRIRQTHGFLDVTLEADNATISETYYGDTQIRAAAQMFLEVFTEIMWSYGSDEYYEELAKTLDISEIEKLRVIIQGGG